MSCAIAGGPIIQRTAYAVVCVRIVRVQVVFGTFVQCHFTQEQRRELNTRLVWWTCVVSRSSFVEQAWLSCLPARFHSIQTTYRVVRY